MENRRIIRIGSSDRGHRAAMRLLRDAKEPPRQQVHTQNRQISSTNDRNDPMTCINQNFSYTRQDKDTGKIEKISTPKVILKSKSQIIRRSGLVTMAPPNLTRKHLNKLKEISRQKRMERFRFEAEKIRIELQSEIVQKGRNMSDIQLNHADKIDEIESEVSSEFSEFSIDSISDLSDTDSERDKNSGLMKSEKLNIMRFERQLSKNLFQRQQQALKVLTETLSNSNISANFKTNQLQPSTLSESIDTLFDEILFIHRKYDSDSVLIKDSETISKPDHRLTHCDTHINHVDMFDVHQKSGLLDYKSFDVNSIYKAIQNPSFASQVRYKDWRHGALPNDYVFSHFLKELCDEKKLEELAVFRQMRLSDSDSTDDFENFDKPDSVNLKE